MNAVSQTLIDNDAQSTAVQPFKETAQHVAVPLADMTPIQMAYQLIQSGADPASVKDMLALSRELAAEQARRAFDAAIADAKAAIPIIGKNATGHNNKRYADFSAYAAALRPILKEHGLSYRFKAEQTDRITVTCILSHRGGHSEENSLSGPADASGSKNAIQAVGSTLTYLQRYTLIQALGLAAGEDDDGKAAGDSGPIDEEQFIKLDELLQVSGANREFFCEKYGIEKIEHLPASKFVKAYGDVEAWFKREQQQKKAGA